MNETKERAIPPNCPNPECGVNIAVKGYSNHCKKNPDCTWIVCNCRAVIDTSTPGRWMEGR